MTNTFEMTAHELEIRNAIRFLTARGAYHVLKRFEQRTSYGHDASVPAEPKMGLYVDTETTSLDSATARIIELAIVPFTFDVATATVRIVSAGESWLADPGAPIDSIVTEVTGITDEMVAGKYIDRDRVLELLGVNMPAALPRLVVAHNAEYDRPVLEREIADFAAVDWACSWAEVPWKRFGASSGKLAHILMDCCGEFFDAHRALDDARVGVHVLAAATLDGRTAFSHLIESTSRPIAHVWASGAPYEARVPLKARGYQWNDGKDGRRKAWHKMMPSAELELERVWLRDVAGSYSPHVKEITARDRYSVRQDR